MDVKEAHRGLGGSAGAHYSNVSRVSLSGFDCKLAVYTLSERVGTTVQ